MKNVLKLNSILIASLTLGAMGVTDCQAKGNYNSAAADLMGAFQTGCSLNGNYLQLALNQTQYFAQTAQDLGKNASCAGVNGALSTIQNLQTQISSINNNSYASQISNLSTIQSGLMLQISQATDPATLATLSTTYSNNLLSLGEAEYYAGTSGSGAAAMTSLQTGSTQVNGYLTQLLSDQTNITQCAADNPALAAQLGAGMIAVAGSFTPSVAGTALTLAGNAINTAIGFIQARQFSKQVDKLNQVQMTTALPCGLEQMTDIYCQAQDIIDITQLQACSYNPSAPGCPAQAVSKTAIEASPFWQGLEGLEHELPALQLWLNQVVTGITPSNPYAAQNMNDAEAAVALLDNVSRLAQGVMKNEEVKIAALILPADQDKELRNALAILEAVLAADSTNTGCTSSFGGGSGCTPTPIYLQEGSATQLLYDLVGRNPTLDNCVPSSVLSQCPNASSIILTGVAGANDLATWINIENNAGGLPTTPPAALNLIANTLSRYLLLEHQQLNTDPSDLMGKMDAPAGEGLPSPIKALQRIDAFLNASLAYFSDPNQVPDSILDAGTKGRAGIVGELKDSEKMVAEVISARSTMTGVKDNDLLALNRIFTTLQLASDRNFIFNRLSDQIKFDVHTRIISGQIPKNIYEILSQSELDPTIGLTQISPDAMEQTLASLGQAKSTAQLNVQNFATFFSKSLNSVLVLLKSQADSNQEPMIANPAVAPNRAAQARICLLLASSQNQWPKDVDPGLCRGLSYQSIVTGKSLNFDAFFSQLQSGSTRAPQRMCSFYHFYRESENYTHEKQQD